MRKLITLIFLLVFSLIKLNGQTPNPPTVGAITQPTCNVTTGSVVLSDLPSSGTWTVTRTPGGTTTTGTGTSTTITELPAGSTYTFTVTNLAGNTSTASSNVIIDAIPSAPSSPVIGTTTQPTCTVSTGSVVLSGLPASGTWTINPGSITGSGTSTTISGIPTGTYNYTVTNASGCTSTASDNVVINAQPSTPTAPTVGTITQPTCTVATGSVVLSGLPASGTWTINPGSITGSGTSTTISGIVTSTYNYTVTNASGCISPASGNVVINAQPIQIAPTTGTITQPTCAVATGSVILSDLPASGNWTINPGSITGSGTSTTISNLATGTYNYTVTNASVCTSTASGNVVINAQPIQTAPIIGTITQPTCTVATGSVVLSGLPASGTWTINPGSITGSGTSTTISNLVTGTYNYTVTNASGCISPVSDNVVINAQPSTPTTLTVGTITQPTCTVATGSAVLSGLPASGTWTINPGSITGSGTSTTISGIATGTYNYTVTNASGCISPASDNVVINAQPTQTAPTIGTVTQPTCTVATGSVVLSGLPASGTWTINPGSITGSGTSTTISGIPTGTFNYTVTNASGCTSTVSGNVIINAQPIQTAPATGTITQPTCTVATGSVVLSGLPASGNWTINPGSITGSGTSTTISGIPAGTYNYTVTNASGCTSTASDNVVINAQPSTPTAPTVGTITQPTCTVATGSVALSGLPAAGTWTINPGSITGSGTSTTISGIQTGTFNFTVTNASGCTSPASDNVVINAQPTQTAPTIGTRTQPTCTVATGSVVLSGLPASGTWTINPGSITGSGTSTTISGIPTGTYNYTVTNASGCTSQASGNVVINAQPTQTAPTIGTITQPTCTVATGSVVLSGLPASGTWTINPGSITGSGTSTTISNLSTGTYNYTVTNASGCISLASDNVVINAQPSTPTSPTVGTITQPTCTVASGRVVLSGLPASGTWTINPGSITGSGTSTTISGIPTGTYNYTVTNASGCTSPVSGNVVINSQPTQTAPTIGTRTQPTCTVATGSVVLSGLPASGTWTINPGSITGSGTSTTISGIATGTYNYTVTNASGCISPVSGNVVINAQPTQTAPAIGNITQPTCTVATGSVDLSDLPASGTWTIYPGSITGSGTSTTISNLETGTYNYTVTNTSGCTSQASDDVVINAQPTQTAPRVGTITQPTCTVATGSVVLSGLPASGNWTINPGSITGSGTSTTISNLATGTYNYTVTSASGCISPASNNVVINAQPSTPTTPTAGTITQPTCTVATGSVVLSGLPASGNWTINPGSITGSGTSTTISGIPTGTYNYTVTNASGCTSPVSGNVTINAQPSTPTTPIIGTISQPTCTVATGSVVLNSLPASGTWSLTRNPGATTTTGTGTSSTISGLGAGTYNFTVTNASGCTSPVSANVVINAQPSTPTTPTVGTTTQPTCTVATGSVVLSGLPASGTWTINPGSITGSGISTTISGIPTGTYNYTVTNASGCISPASGNVVINAQPTTPTTPAIGTISQPTCTVATGSVVLNSLPASGTWTLTRNPGGTTTTGTGTSSTISGLGAGTYNYTVTNASGCTSPASANVVINAQPSTPTIPTVGTITQPTCTVATGSVVLSVLPASGTWTINPGSITGSGTSTTVSGIPSGIYNYTVTNTSGCTSPVTGNVVINAHPATPTTPTIGTISQPTCTVATGSVVLNSLPASGTWTITRNPGGTTTTGTGTSSTISGLAAGTYNYTVTNASGCSSSASANVVINAQPSTPTAPAVGTITQPTCTVVTGSVVLSGLPATGTWTLTRSSDGITTTGTGTSITISGIASGTYTFKVTNASGCSSVSSGNAVVNAQPPTLSAPTIGIITQPLLNELTGSVTLNGLPTTGIWTITRTPDGTTTTGTGSSTTISGLAAGTYTFNITNVSACKSPASANVVLYTTKLYGLDDKVLNSNDTVRIDQSDAGSVLFRVESDAGWTVSDNSLWFRAVKESNNSTIKVIFMENISAVDKVAPFKLKYASNAEAGINILQKARVSQLNVSKFENIKIYPNPSYDFVYLYFGDNYPEKIRISIATIQGTVLKTRELTYIQANQIIELDVAELRVGQYLIQLSDGKYQKIFHLIKY